MDVKTHFLLAIFLTVCLLMLGCSSGTPSPLEEESPVSPGVATERPGAATEKPGKPGRTPGPRPTKPGSPGLSKTPVSGMDEGLIVSGNTEFAFDMLAKMDLSLGNLVYSPFSISNAFALAYAGARGDTATQMEAVLHFPTPSESFHPAFGALSTELTAGSASEDFTLNLANSLWGQEGRSFLPVYLDLLESNYGAGMGFVDFEDHPDDARQVINDWVADQTENRIKDVLQPGSISSSTRLVLVNAIYFKALWEFQFDPDKTSKETFDLLSGAEVDVDMMLLDELVPLSYAQGEDWEAVALPYKGGQADMIIIMPDEEEFTSFFASFDSVVYLSILDKLVEQQMLLSMPKFSFLTGFALADDLAGMGMQDAFDPTRADFSGIDGTTELYIDDTYHLAFIDVDEAGTEAAAATGIVMRSSLPSGFHLTIDRPFFYFIRDISSDTILFMGYVLDPR